LLQAIQSVPKEAPILDLGCGNGFTLKLLAADGFTNLDGIDSHIPMRLKVSRWRWKWRNRTWREPYRLHRGDFTEMHFPARAYDLAFSISVIEHGVRLAPFLEECHRVLKPGGLLFVTADYWDPKVPTNSANHAFGRAWNIFSKEEVERFLFVAEKVGFHLVESGGVPRRSEPMVHWQNKDYTIISLLLRKTQS
jgi:SAM-dependent methyltransferase